MYLVPLVDWPAVRIGGTAVTLVAVAIGTALALVRLHEAKRLGCELGVFGTTPESAALYERYGFTTQPDEGRRWFYLPLEP